MQRVADYSGRMRTIVAARSVIFAVSGSPRLSPSRAKPPGICTGDDSQIWAESVFGTGATRHAELNRNGNGVADEAPPCS